MWMNLLDTIWRERGQEQRNIAVQEPIHISYKGKSNSRPGSLPDWLVVGERLERRGELGLVPTASAVSEGFTL